VPDVLFARLRERFNEAELVELTSSIAWENYRARFSHALGIEGENFSEGAVCALPVQKAEK
jgi:alkylhydroperoxidase family enzyme